MNQIYHKVHSFFKGFLEKKAAHWFIVWSTVLVTLETSSSGKLVYAVWVHIWVRYTVYWWGREEDEWHCQCQWVWKNFVIFFYLLASEVLPYIYGVPLGLWWKVESACNYSQVYAQSLSCPTLWPHGLEPARLLCPWHFPGKNTRVGCHFLLQGIFLTQGLNPCLLHCQADSSPLLHLGNPVVR